MSWDANFVAQPFSISCMPVSRQFLGPFYFRVVEKFYTLNINISGVYMGLFSFNVLFLYPRFVIFWLGEKVSTERLNVLGKEIKCSEILDQLIFLG